MAMATPARRRWDGSRAAVVPAFVLVLGVPLLMSTQAYGIYGLYAIFWAFLVGAAALAIATGLWWFRLASTRVTHSLAAFGGPLSVAAVGLYLVYGCVFGCPG